MTIEFTIPGVPQGKERPRFTQNGATYTPKKTKDYEKLVAWAYQCEAHGAKFTGTIRVDIAAIYPVPHSWSKRKQAEAIDNQILPMVKPDWDNIGKIVCDALNGIAYKDDAVITDATVCKRYGTRPCVAFASPERRPPVTQMEDEVRNQFTFYRSFFEAVFKIKSKAARAEAYDAICKYALFNNAPDVDKMSDAAAIAFMLIKPNLDASRRKAKSGKTAGPVSKPQVNRKQTVSKVEAKRKQTVSKSNPQARKRKRRRKRERKRKRTNVIPLPPFRKSSQVILSPNR